jgi:hypothetical protein
VTWLFLLLTMAVIALAVGVVTGRIVGSMNPPATSLPFQGLPDDVDPADLETLRFDAAFRGYRMGQVDGVINSLATALRSRDEEIVRLREAMAGGGGEGDGDGDVGELGAGDEVPAEVDGLAGPAVEDRDTRLSDE